jgi:hypothetical protein
MRYAYINFKFNLNLNLHHGFPLFDKYQPPNRGDVGGQLNVLLT